MVTNDTSLSHSKKEAIICFITTFKASSEYWSNNYSEWLKLTDKATTRSFKFDWKQVAVADAYWTYTGLLSSGLNVWVGGGAAAVGSVTACLK